MRKARCEWCGIEFEAQRRSARFCSDVHRAAYHYAQREGNIIPARDTVPWLFEKRHKNNLEILREFSPEAADALIALVSEYGAQTGDRIFEEIIRPLHEEYRARYNALVEWEHSPQNEKSERLENR